MQLQGQSFTFAVWGPNPKSLQQTLNENLNVPREQTQVQRDMNAELCLSERDNVSRCIYLHQILYIYVKICIHEKQDFNIRIKIYVHVSRSACENI